MKLRGPIVGLGALLTLAMGDRIEAASDGAALAHQVCASCHLFPEPDSLPKAAWTNVIRPAMAQWLGLEQPRYEAMPGGDALRRAAVFPTAPLLSSNASAEVWRYYAEVAPEELKLPPRAPAAPLGQFRARKINPASGAPMMALVKIDSAGGQLQAGDAFAGMYYSINPAGEVLRRLRLGSAPVHVARTGARQYLTLIGGLFPSDLAEGSVVRLPARADVMMPRPLLEKLHRPVQTIPADLNQDGREDLVVVTFGHHIGHFSWFENEGDGRFTERILIDRPGAVHAEVLDADGDGRPDIFVMMAQAREGIYLLLNKGQGSFTVRTLIEKPPTWGFVGFELADFNADGKADILAVNGDNGDFNLPARPYHGLRIYLNDGANGFREAWFYPLPGAYRALVRDFDADGDSDIAAVAFYPDYSSGSPENFVYLENQGGLRFLPHSLPEAADGRWMTLDAGDLDGDGDIDIALGSFVRGPTTQPIPAAVEARWRTNGAAILLLENLRKPRP